MGRPSGEYGHRDLWRRQHSWTDRMLFFLYTLPSTSQEVNLAIGGIIELMMLFTSSSLC